MPGWAFTERVDRPRQAALDAVRDFNEIVARIAAEAAELVPGVDEADGDVPHDHKRPAILFRVPEDVGDLFFNSPVGYRGQLLEGAECGVEASRRVIGALEQQLLAAFDGRDWDLSRETITASLRHPRAKVWVKQARLPGWPWRDLIEDIVHPAWNETARSYDQELQRRRAADEPNPWGERGPGRRAVWGVRAPLCQWLEIKGSWLDCQGAPADVGKSPQQRADELRQSGWT